MERGLTETKGELFAILRGNILYTLDGEMSGKVDGHFVVDLGGKPIWRVFGDGVYKLDGLEPVGFFGTPRPIDDEYRD
ncbi:MAG: hypothetical protein AAF633_15615 [Chloroflexota bacterium]